MDITNENFISELPEICRTIHECDFIAIDTELSGLLRERILNRFDLPEERYAKSLKSSRGYFIMQFGLSCFTKIDHCRYSNRTYNFYIFPQAHKVYGDIDRTMSIQAHAIQFLTDHNFDFNRLFKHGISYLTFDEKKFLTAQLKDEMKTRSKAEFNTNGVPKFVPNSMINFCKASLQEVDKFVSKQKKEGGGVNDNSSQRMKNRSDRHADVLGDENNGDSMRGNESSHTLSTMDIRDCGTHKRRLILKQALECSPVADNIYVQTLVDPDTNESYLAIEYMDKATKSERQKNALLEAKGFLEIVETIIISKKPLVGHNLLLDLVQIINQFIEQLGDDYDSFKDTCHSLFPLIYDTKFIAHNILDPKTLTQNQSRLNDLYCQLRLGQSFPRVHIEQLGPAFDENQLPHQAGFDAYMSGFSFIVLCEAYLKQVKRDSGRDKDRDTESVAKNREVVCEFANKIHLSYSYDYKFYNLSGNEDSTDRSNVFYVEFPSSWGLDDLFQLFGQLGGVEASKISRTSALCALRDPKQIQATMIKAKKLQDTHANHRIYTYEKYLEKTRAASEKEARPGKATSCDYDVDVSDA